ncbi:MAG: transposase [Proteobacteria bacterium]|nr:transposase [Pseudomonadota bacterium]
MLPIVWKTVRGNKGHVTGEIHRTLLKQVYPLFSHHRRVVVLGDAEFSNERVISWLRRIEWDFVLRFQSSYLVKVAGNDEWQSTKSLYQSAGLQPGRVLHWMKVTFTQSHQFADLNITTQWAEGEDQVLCLVSSLSGGELPHVVYEMRYWVETLFSNHKSRGFQLARTQMTDPEHIDRLFLVLAIATCMTLGFGTHLTLIKETHQVDRADRRDLSLFQTGWRWFFRLLALDRLHEHKITFDWSFTLPPPGFQPAA